MRKLIYLLIGMIAVAGIFMYFDRYITSYELQENDVVVKNGEYQFVGRVSDDSLVEQVEAYHKTGGKLNTFSLDDVTKDALSDSKFLSDMRIKEKEFKGIKLTTEKERGEDKIYYHFEHKGTKYKHKLLPHVSKTKFFHWNKIHAMEIN